MVNGRLVFVPIDADTVASSGLSALLDKLATIDAVGDLAMAPGERVQHPGASAAALSKFGLDEMRHVAAALDDAHRYLDGSVVEYFRRRIEACKADDGNLGPRKALPVVLGILGAIEQHGREVKPDVRRQLLSLGQKEPSLPVGSAVTSAIPPPLVTGTTGPPSGHRKPVTPECRATFC